MKKIIVLAALFAVTAPAAQATAGFSDVIQTRDWRLPFRVANELAKHPVTKFIAPRVLTYGGTAVYLLRVMTYTNYIKFFPNVVPGLKKAVFSFKKNWLGSPCERVLDPGIPVSLKDNKDADATAYMNESNPPQMRQEAFMKLKNRTYKGHNKAYADALRYKIDNPYSEEDIKDAEKALEANTMLAEKNTNNLNISTKMQDLFDKKEDKELFDEEDKNLFDKLTQNQLKLLLQDKILRNEAMINSCRWSNTSFELGEDPHWINRFKQFGVKTGAEALLTIALAPIFYKQISGDISSLGNAAASLWTFLTRAPRAA